MDRDPRALRQALDRYPTAKGEYRIPFKMGTKLPTDEAYLETECPRGQMGFYVAEQLGRVGRVQSARLDAQRG